MRYGSIGLAAAGAYAFACHLGRTWGSTREERGAVMPGDELLHDPMVVTDHAITIRGRREDVWPWLVQMGWHRGGWYTYRWIDLLLFPANAPSADVLLPAYQDLSVGDRIPDGPPETACDFVVERADAPAALVLRSHSHLPPWPRDRWLDWVWAYELRQVASDRVRLRLRTSASLGPPWLAFVYRALIWTDFVMGRSHLRGIRDRVEGAALAEVG
ncbi:MAG TPA: hypothetical protein VK646_01115 [Actinomycetota bacterium]|nr:hypothetical protein [Actinomycetota bacterium]